MSLKKCAEVSGFELLRLLPYAILNALIKANKISTRSHGKKTFGASAIALKSKQFFLGSLDSTLFSSCKVQGNSIYSPICGKKMDFGDRLCELQTRGAIASRVVWI